MTLMIKKIIVSICYNYNEEHIKSAYLKKMQKTSCQNEKNSVYYLSIV